MKHSTPYIILFLIAAAAIGLLLTGNNEKEMEFDERITLRRRDKIPYGARLAYDNLSSLFPRASISVNKDEPGYWDSLSTYSNGQALVILSPRFYADEFEMKKLIRFAENGNDVFISTRMVSSDVEDIMGIKTSLVDEDILRNWPGTSIAEPLSLGLTDPPYDNNIQFTYDGPRYSAWVPQIDSSITNTLGVDGMGRTNFIHFRAGTGHVYLHLAPMAFSNYFLLQEDNMRYYGSVLSVISPQVTKLVWDEYYLNKRSYYDRENESNAGWMSVLFRYKALKWALLIAMLTLVVYVLMEMRRRQRYIPVIPKTKNDSLDFVKTIGRLYYDRGDHLNLCRKMASFFLEHIRNKYKLATGTLDDEFIKRLQFKTGAAEGDIRDIVTFINEMGTAERVTEKQAADFHKKLESFYQKA